MELVDQDWEYDDNKDNLTMPQRVYIEAKAFEAQKARMDTVFKKEQTMITMQMQAFE